MTLQQHGEQRVSETNFLRLFLHLALRLTALWLLASRKYRPPFVAF
jgi:hypothetical protein